MAAMRSPQVVAMVIAATLIGGCQSLPQQQAETRLVASEPLVWPQPPQQARIRFIQTVATPKDLGLRPSFWGRVGELLIGKLEPRLIRPTGVVAQGATLYVADPGARSLWILDANARRWQQVRTIGKRALVSPVAVAIGRGGRIYLVDSYLAVIAVYDASGRLSASITHVQFQRPCGVAYDAPHDRLYVADSAAHRIWILAGSGEVQGSIGQRGIGNGEFNFPTHVAVDRQGMVYVTDSLNFRVQFFSPDGTYAGQFGRHGDASGEFAMPKGIAVDHDGHLYVVEALFDAVQIFDRAGRFLLSIGEQGTRPGQFWLPGGIWIDPADRLYIADAYNKRIQVFEYVADQSRS